MKKIVFRTLSIGICAFLLCSFLVGCTTGSPTAAPSAVSTTAAEPTTAETVAAETSTPTPTQAPVYPVTTDKTLTYFVFMQNSQQAHFANLADTPYAKAKEKATGIKCTFINPTDFNQFTTMIASGEYPDIMEIPWEACYPGGSIKAMQDGVIIKLDDLKDSAANLFSYLSANPQIDQMIRTGDGEHLFFPAIDTGNAFRGPIVRKDWLDSLGLAIPETVDDWHTMLTQFKDKKSATAPFTLRQTWYDTPFIVGAYGISPVFYVDNGKVKYGPYEAAYKDFLQTYAQWYKEGLIDKDIATVDSKLMDAKMTTGQSGATFTYPSSIVRYTNAGKASDPNFSIVGVPYPVLQKGTKCGFSEEPLPYDSGTNQGTISTKCKEPKLAALYLDYNYGKEGSMLANYGIESDSYTLNADGTAKFTEKMFNSPDGWSFFEMLAAVAYSSASGPYVRDPNLTKAEQVDQIQRDAMDIWSNTDQKLHALPSLSIPTDQATEASKLMNDINVYRGEIVLKFIFGQESIDNFAQYQAQLKTMGIERVLEIEQAGYDAYLNKK